MGIDNLNSKIIPTQHCSIDSTRELINIFTNVYQVLLHVRTYIWILNSGSLLHIKIATHAYVRSWNNRLRMYLLQLSQK